MNDKIWHVQAWAQIFPFFFPHSACKTTFFGAHLEKPHLLEYGSKNEYLKDSSIKATSVRAY